MAEIWPVSVDALLNYFREALLALVPIADKIHMPWKEPESYDDWDTICATLYRSIVIMSVENATESHSLFPMPDYDRRISSYNDKTFIGSVEFGESCAFICLETKIAPFDTCFFAKLDIDGTVIDYMHSEFKKVKFVVIGRQLGSSSTFKDLEVAL